MGFNLRNLCNLRIKPSHMHWHIFVIGKPKLAYAKAGVEEYARRIRLTVPLAIEFLKPAGSESESDALLRRSAGMFRLVLDERGKEFTSRQFAGKVSEWELRGIKSVALIVGGADGHTEALRESADCLMALGRLTLQHELALVVALEQVYRAYSIKAGTPYHRDSQ